MHTMGLVAIFSIVWISSFVVNNGLSATYNVMNYGASGAGRRDDTNAFKRAWEALCEDVEGTPTLHIPRGNSFLLRPIQFQGPCKSPTVKLQILGKIVAPKNIGAWRRCEADSWLYFSRVNGLTVEGSGQINGRGSSWWNKTRISDTEEKSVQGCSDRPTALHFFNCNGLKLNGSNHLNSPRNHISINSCEDVTISNLRIVAPQDSPNTDGIDISSSSQVHIYNSIIQTGDDCVAIGNGSSNINITRVACGPGHGISVGSLGANGSHAIVEKVHVRHCSFRGTENGVRIKTWPGGSGYVRHITFEHIKLRDADNPIIIDQHYCNGAHNCAGDEPHAAAVQVSDVTYKYIQGSSASKQAINLDCSDDVACTNILMEHINIVSGVPGVATNASCQNAHGKSLSTSPSVPCLL